jgi:hypothetical protein
LPSSGLTLFEFAVMFSTKVKFVKKDDSTEFRSTEVRPRRHRVRKGKKNVLVRLCLRVCLREWTKGTTTKAARCHQGH